MAAQERRSKKRSASSAAPPDPRELGRIVFFIDRSLGNKYVPEVLRSAGARVEVHESHFPSEAEDTDWLEEVGRRGWIVLTKDERIRYRTHEVAAIMVLTRDFGIRSMVTKPIKTRADHRAALKAVEELIAARQGTRDGERLDVLVTSIEAYERKHFPMDA